MKKKMLREDGSAFSVLLATGVMVSVFVALSGVLYVMTIGMGDTGNIDYNPAPLDSYSPRPGPSIPSPQPVNPNPPPVIEMPNVGQSTVEADYDNFGPSTFGADVDTGSYVYARNSINYGRLPSPDTVRTEEFLNYFDYHYPEGEGVFSVHTECGPSHFSDDSLMLKIGIKAKSISVEEREPMTIICVIDTSGSMSVAGKLDLVKQTLPYLVDQMVEGDRLGIVIYESTARYYLNPLGLDKKAIILSEIEKLSTAGSTNAQDGLMKGYEMALEYRQEGRSSRLMLFSDGVANTGIYDVDGLVSEIQRYKEMGIYLSTYGFGMGEYNDQLMEQLADNGDGRYGYIDSLEEAKRELVQNINGNLVTVAKDLKVKVDFNPEVVKEYRLVGYDNRVMTEEEFEDEAKDSGDVGAGHTVTVLYEIKIKASTNLEDLAAIEMRYKEPDTLISRTENVNIRWNCIEWDIDETSPQFRFALCVAEFAEFLMGSPYCDSEISDIIALTVDALDEYVYETPWETEFAQLLEDAKALV